MNQEKKEKELYITAKQYVDKLSEVVKKELMRAKNVQRKPNNCSLDL